MQTHVPINKCEILTSITELITILAQGSPGFGGDLEQLIIKAKALMA